MSLIARFLDWWDGVPPVSETKETLTDGFLAPLTREALLSDEHIKHRLTTLKRSGIGLPYEVWDEFVVDTIVAFSQYTQELPASEHHHHAYKRGLLLHSLDVAIYALRIRRNYALPPLCAPEDRTFREIVWVYGVFIAALLHDAGKVFDFEIQLLENNQQQKWDYTTPITQPYRFRPLKAQQDDAHKALAHSLLSRVLSQNPMRALTHDRQLWNALSDHLTGQAREDNVLSEIVKQADAASVAQDLGAEGEDISIAAEKARDALPASVSRGEMLSRALKHVISSKVALNDAGASAYVIKDSMYVDTSELLSLMSTELQERNESSDNVLDDLQHYALISDISEYQIELDSHSQTLQCATVELKKVLPNATFKDFKGTITIAQNVETTNVELQNIDSESQLSESEINSDLMSIAMSLNETNSDRCVSEFLEIAEDISNSESEQVYTHASIREFASKRNLDFENFLDEFIRETSAISKRMTFEKNKRKKVCIIEKQSSS